MRALWRPLAVTAVVAAASLVPGGASALCNLGEWYFPCSALASCNNNAVCGSNETPSSCPSDCPCAHDTCTPGAALNAACQTKVWLAWAVCQYDGYCCTTAWDQQCVDEANRWGTQWAQTYGMQTDGCRGNSRP